MAVLFVTGIRTAQRSDSFAPIRKLAA